MDYSSIVGPIVNGVLGVANLAYSASRDNKQDKWNKKVFDAQMKQQEWQNNFAQDTFNKNYALAQDAQNFEKDYAMNKYQYAVSDAGKAGINPLAMSGMSIGSASVSGGSASAGNSSGEAPTNPAVSNGVSGAISSAIQSSAQLEIAKINSKTQKDIAKDKNDTDRQIATDQLNNAVALQQSEHLHQANQLIKELTSNEKIANAKLSQQDKEFLTTTYLREAELNRRFMLDKDFQEFRKLILNAESARDFERLQHDKKFDWIKLGTDFVTNSLKLGVDALRLGSPIR